MTVALAILRRRWWILLLSVAACCAAAVGVASLRSPSSSAQATLLVPPSFGSQTPGAASEATALASTYAQLIPEDAAIAHAVARRLGVDDDEVRRSISADRDGKSAVLRVSYEDASRETAIRGAQALGIVLTRAVPDGSAVASRSLLLAQTPDSARSATSDLTPSGVETTRRWRASARVVVNSGAGPTSPANADGATRLARTYAGILADDDAVATRVARTLDTTAGSVRSHVTISNDANTSLLRVRYRAATASGAVAGATAFARTVSSADPPGSNLAAGALSIVRLPASASEGGGITVRDALPIGVVLGLVIGLVLVLARERADRRIDSPADLADELGVPATSLRSLAPGAAGTLLRRWRDLNGDGPATRVALVGAGRDHDSDVASIAERLARAGKDAHIETTVGYAGRDEESGGEGVVMMLPNGTGAEGAAMASDLVVLLVDEGARARQVRAVAGGLGGLGRAPVWALLTPRTRRWRS